ncbi:MAG TPA: protein kinase [Vicinamibacteria bacterium]|nr:protein kinase [Vicinamibacteria bacterium]
MKRCPDCRSELVSERGIAGLCPQCLLSLALRDSPAPGSADSEAATVDRPAPGRILGERYQIREVLGRGGMGEVFRAFDLKLRVEVALKAVRVERVASDRAREMLRSEVRAAREVVSPNVCRIFDLVVEDGQELVSMEYVDGVTLADWLKDKGPLELGEAREIASQFLAGLQAIHLAGLVHRDFKPENVMVTRAGRVVVMDFGLAKLSTEGGTGSISGTPGYMAPEQARGDSVDARTDVFAAGVVLAEMLAVGGARSFEARQTLWAAVREAPPRVPDGPWAPVLRQALAANAQDRPGSAHALARALEEVTLRLPGFEQRRPYPGLASFTEEDAEYFFGREVEVEAVWKKLRRPRLLALVGPSGAGKSSFLRAGLLPTLPGTWKAVITTPGGRPFQSLARALAPVFAGDAQATDALLRFEEPDTAVSLLRRFRQRNEHALLIVDQFEELFTLNGAEVQEAFAKLLGRLVLEADLHVVLSLRDDFLLRCHAYDSLAPAFADLTPLGTLTESALRRALVQPALACGYRFEDESLVEEMVAELGRERGALPLLAFAASSLWERRDRERGLLTREAYQEIGGVAGALAQHAEAALERTGTERIPVVRELFRNLVTSEGTRAVRERGELLSVFRKEGDPEAGAEAEQVLNSLVDARLLTAYHRAGDGDESHQQVEIIHESLLRNWPRLVRWQTQDADGAQLRDQLRQAAQLWHDRGQPEDLLWSGQAYLDFSLWRERYPGSLSTTEDAFARAMLANATRRRRRRRAAAAALLAAAASVAIVTSVLWQRADASRRKAEAETLRAEAGKLLVLGEREIERDPTAALAYALKGLELADTEVGRLLALRVLQSAPTARIAPVAPGVALRNDFSPNGEWIALGGFTRVELLHKDGGPSRLLGEYPSKGQVSAMVGFGPNSDVLLASYMGDVRLWSVPDGRELRRAQIEGPPGDWTTKGDFFTESKVGTRTVIRRWSFGNGEPQEIGSMEGLPQQPDHAYAGGWLAYGQDRKVYLRSVGQRLSQPRLLAEHAAPVTGLGVSRDGKHVAAASGIAGEVRVWPTSPGGSRPERVLHAPGTLWSYFDPSGRRIAAVGIVEGRPTISLFDLEAPGTEPPVFRRADVDFVNEVSFDPSGQWLVTSHFKDAALWWIGQEWPSVLSLPHDDGRVGSLAFTPDGRWLLGVPSSSSSGVLAWPLTTRDEPRRLLGEGYYWSAIAVDPSGQRAAVGLDRGRLSLVRLDGGPPRPLRGFSERATIGAVAFGDGGRLLAAALRNSPRDEKVVRVFDLDSGTVRSFGPLPGAGDGRAGHTLGLEFLDADRLLASVSGTGLVSVDLRSGESQVLAAQPDGPFRLSQDRRLGLGLHDVWNADRPASLVRFSLDGTASLSLGSYGKPTQLAVALDPSGRLVAAGDTDGTVRIGSVEGGEPHVLMGHRSGVVAMAFSPDGRWLASTANDRTVRIWAVPDVTKPPPHRRPYDELLAALGTHTNVRAIADPASPTGYKLEVGPFPGWARPPEW